MESSKDSNGHITRVVKYNKTETNIEGTSVYVVKFILREGLSIGVF